MDVFLVEDSELLRSRLEALIGRIPGARAVGYAEGADDAVKAILEKRPQAVILDMHLKQGNGFDVLRALQGKLGGIPIYILTNYALDTYRDMTAKLGASGFFDKSRDLNELQAALIALAGA